MTWLKDKKGEWDMDAFTIYNDVMSVCDQSFETEKYKQFDAIMKSNPVIREVFLSLGKILYERWQRSWNDCAKAEKELRDIRSKVSV